MKFNDVKDLDKKVPKPGSFKHYHRMAENGGRIVKGVNTTPDVGPDEIKTQAAKFGNTVDKDGRPPTLSKKVKGSSTNVLFNLGLTEGIKLRLERDDNVDVLHIMDTKDKHRIEVRGKKGYETDYDAQDKLHQVLDRVGKAANISELMNGEVVSINPNHPQGSDAIKTAQKVLTTEAQELASASEIYVDMDGVLVDFFGAWTKMMGVDNWKQIKNVDTALQKIRDKDDFWLTLKPTKNAGKLLAIIKKIKGEYNILSAPLAGDPKAEPHKREWIAKYLKIFPPKKVIITADKQKYATQPDGTPNILIDDFGQNVAKWEGAGGVGFKHKDHKFERTATQLADYISPERNEEIAEILGFATRSPKRATRTVKRRPPEEDSVQDKIKKRRALASKVGVKKAFASDTKFDEGSVKIPARGLRDYVISMLDDVDVTKDNKTFADIARMLGKEVYYKDDSVVIQDPDFDFNKETSEGSLLPNPKNTFLTKADTGYDHYKVGTNLANLKTMPKGANYDEPDVVIAPYAGEKEMKYLMKQLKRIGYSVQDAQGYQDAHYDEQSGEQTRYLIGVK